MQVIESKLEIGHVAEIVSLSFEGLDFVVNPFDQAARDTVKVIIQEAMAVTHQSVGDCFELFDT